MVLRAAKFMPGFTLPFPVLWREPARGDFPVVVPKDLAVTIEGLPVELGSGLADIEIIALRLIVDLGPPHDRNGPLRAAEDLGEDPGLFRDRAALSGTD